MRQRSQPESVRYIWRGYATSWPIFNSLFLINLITLLQLHSSHTTTTHQPTSASRTTAKMVIAHTGIKTAFPDTAKVVAWYEKALAPLGYKKTIVIMDGIVNGYSDGVHVDFWVSAAQEGIPVPNHHAFAAKSECPKDSS